MDPVDLHCDEHDDQRDHGHHHDGGHRGLAGAIRELLAPHSHDAKDSLDQALEASSDGIRAVALSLSLLLATAGVQALVVLASGSVALLGDTLHNAADALTAVPLWLAFRLSRRAPTTRFTYGYGKAEDVAGLAVIALIAASAGFAGNEAIHRLLHPQKVSQLGFVMVAAVVGPSGMRLSPSTGSESVVVSAQRLWRPTAYMPAPMALPPYWCWSVPSRRHSGHSGPIRWWDCSSPPPSSSSATRPCVASGSDYSTRWTRP